MRDTLRRGISQLFISPIHKTYIQFLLIKGTYIQVYTYPQIKRTPIFKYPCPSHLSFIFSLFLIQSNLFFIISDSKCHCCFGYLSFDLVFVVT